MNYVYNVPTPYVETNIRTVYFHHFFKGRVNVADSEILQHVKDTLPEDNPREWFWALMDYGAFLKKQGVGNVAASKHYRRQPRFDGSVRQVRGRILATLLDGALSNARLRAVVGADERYDKALQGLMKDGLVSASAGYYRLTK